MLCVEKQIKHLRGAENTLLMMMATAGPMLQILGEETIC